MKFKSRLFSIILISSFLVSAEVTYANKNAKVARALFTTSIIDREPIDQVLVLNKKVKTVSFFTDLRHFNNQTVTHKWIYKGKTESVVMFKVKGPRWRVYSQYTFKPNQLGKWSVVVQDEKGVSIKASVFRLVDKHEQQVILPKP